MEMCDIITIRVKGIHGQALRKSWKNNKKLFSQSHLNWDTKSEAEKKGKKYETLKEIRKNGQVQFESS